MKISYHGILFGKVIIFAALLFVFSHFYFLQAFQDFSSGRTTLDTHFETKNTKIPTIIIKHFPQFKIANNKIFQSVIPTAPQQNLTFWQIFENVNFGFRQDYDIFQDGIKLEHGENIIGKFITEVKSVATWTGLCTIISSNATRGSFKKLEFLSKSKVLKWFFVRFTDENFWQDTVYGRWQQHTPRKLNLQWVPKTLRNFEVSFSAKEINLLDGIQNREECIEKILKQANCSEICTPVLFNFLPKIMPCTTVESYKCMITFVRHETLEVQTYCFNNKVVTKYDYPEEILRVSSFSNDSYEASIELDMNYIAPRVEISIERYITGTTDFIGSVGGSLGLFLGFSIFTFATNIVDKMAKHFQQ